MFNIKRVNDCKVSVQIDGDGNGQTYGWAGGKICLEIIFCQKNLHLKVL